MSPHKVFVGQRVRSKRYLKERGVIAAITKPGVHVMVNWENPSMEIPQMAVNLIELDPTPDLRYPRLVLDWLDHED